MPPAQFGPEYAENVMFLCNHNSCRSQMADGFLQHLRGEGKVGVASAGIVGGTAVKPGAVVVMKEVGIDISGFRHSSNGVSFACCAALCQGRF